ARRQPPRRGHGRGSRDGGVRAALDAAVRGRVPRRGRGVAARGADRAERRELAHRGEAAGAAAAVVPRRADEGERARGPPPCVRDARRARRERDGRGGGERAGGGAPAARLRGDEGGCAVRRSRGRARRRAGRSRRGALAPARRARARVPARPAARAAEPRRAGEGRAGPCRGPAARGRAVVAADRRRLAGARPGRHTDRQRRPRRRRARHRRVRGARGLGGRGRPRRLRPEGRDRRDRARRDPDPRDAGRARIRLDPRYISGVRRRLAFLVISVAATLVVLGLVFAGSPTVIAGGVTIDGVDVGGMQAKDARALLERKSAAVQNTPVVFTAGGRRYPIRAIELGVEPDWRTAIDDAQRQGGGFKRLDVQVFGADVSPPTTVLHGALEYKLSLIAKDVDRAPRNASIVRHG